jgi:DNA polymerase III subunit delta
MIKEYFELIHKIDSNNLKNNYLVYGKESYFIDEYVDKLLQIIIPEEEKGFNEMQLYGKELSVDKLLGLVKSYPMMGQRQLVLVKDFTAMADLNNKEGKAALENYLANPLDSTILILASDTEIKEKGSWFKALDGNKSIKVKFDAIRDNKLPEFVTAVSKKIDLNITENAAHLLISQIGLNLSTIQNELQKIKVNIPSGTAVSPAEIERYVGISKDYNVFELQKAISLGKIPKILEIFNYFSKNEKTNPITLTVSSLFRYFVKVLMFHYAKGLSETELAKMLQVHPYFVKEYVSASRVYPVTRLIKVIHALHIADQKSKGLLSGDQTNADIQRELCFAIIS